MEAAGLAFGVIGVAGLFTTCIQSFDIVVKTRTFSHEFDLLCTQLALQRVRLVLWGETLGLVPNPTGDKIPYNHAIDHGDIRPAIEKSLNHLCLMLQNADVVTSRYELDKDTKYVQSQAGLMIFRERFDLFKTQIRRNQKEKSAWEVTRWAIHDSDKFRAMIGDIRDLMDGLESITSTLGVLARQRTLLAEEVESISDTKSLRLLQEVASSDRTSISLRIVSDAASVQLSLAETPSGDRSLKMTASTKSYHTAPSHHRSDNDGVSSLAALGEGEPGLRIRPNRRAPRSRRFQLPPLDPKPSAPVLPSVSEDRPNRRGQDELVASSIADIPQNRRVMEALLAKGSPQPTLRFTSGSRHYGEALTSIKQTDHEIWTQKSPNLIVSAHLGQSSARRVFLELRSIRNANVPFISAAPVHDALDKVLASIEGPPDTPYEGGVFWISVQFPEAPSAAPTLRFQTRVYHPNIDARGNICADYQQWWYDANLQRYMISMADHKVSWFSESASSRYSLGALLTALCGLLACPNVEDPLVPEIAATYITDYDGYALAAKEYTRKYATGEPPPVDEMQFEDPELAVKGGGYSENSSRMSYASDDVSTRETARAKPKFMPEGEGRELSNVITSERRDNLLPGLSFMQSIRSRRAARLNMNSSTSSPHADSESNKEEPRSSR